MRKIQILLAAFLFWLALFMPAAQAAVADYRDKNNWAYWQQGMEREADCFLVCPTVYLGGEEYNLPLGQEREAFIGALNMERGIYDGSCTMYAPFYQQASLNAYKLKEHEAEPYFAAAYADVRAAFLYYLQHSDSTRPLVLAGFSQGADMCIRLLKEFGREESLQKRLVACYALGWRVTDKELQDYPWLKMAQGAADLGVVITFNTEAPSVRQSLLVPQAARGINPLNWSTDGRRANALYNKGACFTDYSGRIVKEIPYFAGAYLDERRGTLKIDGKITAADYPPVLDVFEPGVFHLYDYQFFYRNLQENVALRVNSYWH